MKAVLDFVGAAGEYGEKRQDEYIRMFEDCSWEYLMNFGGGCTYFRKPATMMEQEEEIFCDDASRLDMLNRVFRVRVIPLILLFVLVIFDGNSALTLGLRILFWVLAGMYLFVFLKFALKYFDFGNRSKGQ